MSSTTRRRGQPPEPPPPPARIDDDPRLGGWRWRTQRIRGDQFGALVDHHCLIAPDGWETKLYQQPTKAIAEALRRVRSRPRAADEPPLTEAEQDAMEALGWKPAGGGARRDGVAYITARAPDGSRHERTRAEWRAAIAAGETAPTKEEPVSTETIPELPTIPPDLHGWEWELSDAGDARLIHPTEGYTTSWGPAGPDADYGGRLAEARKRVTADAVIAAEVAAEERAVVVAGDIIEGEVVEGEEPLGATLEMHAQFFLDARRRVGQGLLDAARAVAEARQQARHGQWGPWLKRTRLSASEAERLIGMHQRAGADPRFAEAIRTGFLSASVAGELAQSDDALLEHFLTREQPPTRAEVRAEKRALANPPPAGDLSPAPPGGFTPPDGPARPAPATFDQHTPRPHPPCARCGLTHAPLIGKNCEGCYSLLEAQKWPDGSEDARWRLAAAQQQAERDPDAERRRRRLAEIAGIARDMGFSTLEATPPPPPSQAPPPPWAADHDKTVYADYVRRFDRCGAVLTCTAPGRAPYALHIAGRGKPVEIATWGELQAQLAAAERAHADLPPDPLAAVRSAIFAGPHRWAEAAERIAALTPQAERETWLDDLALARRADAAMRGRDAAGAWEALQALADAELKGRLLEVYATAAREYALAWPPEPTRAARPGNDPAPALPAGWSWRPRGDNAVQAWDGTIVHMTACYRPGEEGEAAAEAWRKVGPLVAAAPAEETPPLTPPEYGEWAERARAVGATLSRDTQWRYVLTLPDGSIEPREAWLGTVARIRALEVDSPPPAPPEAEESDAVPADARPTYAAAEQRLARLLAAADPELRRFLRVIFAVAALSDDPLSDDDLWDELTGNLIAAGDELLAYALGEPAPAPPAPAPAGDPEFDRWPHVDHPALEELSADLMGAEVASDPPDGGALARWQDTLDAHAAELDDQTYERLAHRIGELRRRVKEAA